MSHNVSKSSGHGFCSAIFSSSPVNFNKENEIPPNKLSKSCYPVIAIDSPIKQKNESEPKTPQCPRYKRSLRNEAPQETKVLTKPTNTNFTRSKSAHSLRKQEISTSEEKIKTPSQAGSTSRLLGDKTPVVHFFTPKHIKSGTPASTVKAGLLSVPRMPVKRYFSDHTLPPATPDCFNAVQVETPCTKSTDVPVEEQTVYEGENSNLTVGIRVRPLSFKELNEPKITSVVKVNGQNIIVDSESSQHTFMYDHCFMSFSNPSISGHTSQETVFKTMVLPLVQNAFEGYNVCLFAYGQTGSGKSYSMMGVETPQERSLVLDEGAGIIPRFCQEIFTESSKNACTKTTVEISYFEIYNEKIHDLLASNNVGAKRAPLKVREHPVFGPYIVDLSQHSVQNYKDLQTWLKVGNSQRATAATGMNEKSSRSHSIFSIILTQTQGDKQQSSKSADASRRSKINLVDLAGSERLSNTCASGDRLREGVSINKSLLILGKVIASLAESGNNRKRGFVPYRESVLTWLLKESLGGNSRTAMLGTVSPANIHLEETLATLRYACQARAIVNRIRINEDPHDRLIRELKAEVLRLRGVREGYEKQLGLHPRRLFDEPITPNTEEVQEKQKEIDTLKEQLKKTEEQLASTQMTWLEKLREAEEKKNSELRYLRRCGIAVEIDLREKHKHPCLINLTADPMLSGTLLYLIPPGVVRVGKNSGTGTPSKQLDIVLDGPLVRQLHCTIENKDGKLILSPEMEADTYVNGQVVVGKILLKHGDRLVIGGNHYFKVSNPNDDHSIQVSTQPIDFEFAHKEILRIQEEKLRAELEESKQKAMKELENAKREIELQLGSQKSTYERQIEDLGLTLEEQKLALEEINRKKRELEFEKELLTSEVETNNRLREMQIEESKVEVAPYKSNFLQELENILNEKTADAEIALKMKISTDAIYAGGISLHEMQILVREATERCRELGINYEFNQQQVVNNKSLQPVVRIRDRDHMTETLWQPMRFLDWVHKLRDYDIEDSMRDLRESTATWESYEDSEVFEDSFNNSRISINMTPVKKHLNESLYQFSMDASLLESSLANQTPSGSETLLQTDDNIKACLIQIELAAKTLCKLCHNCDNGEVYNTVTKSLDKVQNIMENLRRTLEKQKMSESNNESANTTRSVDNTVIEKSDVMDVTSPTNRNTADEYLPSNDMKPPKSNFRNIVTSCPKDGSPQKTVRFIDKKKK